MKRFLPWLMVGCALALGALPIQAAQIPETTALTATSVDTEPDRTVLATDITITAPSTQKLPRLFKRTAKPRTIMVAARTDKAQRSSGDTTYQQIDPHIRA